MWCKDWSVESMNDVTTETCVCGKDVFTHKDGEHSSKYEDFAGKIPHTNLRCEVNQIVSKKFREIEVEVNQLKERMGLL